jgi:hypothetical protein
MTLEEKMNEIHKAQKKWDFCLVIGVVIFSVMGLIGFPYLIMPASGLVEWIVFGAMGFIFNGILATSKFGRLLDAFVRTKWVKSYLIEDCGYVVKLHGYVRGDMMAEAIRDLLSTRPGLKMVDDAYSLYGCTFAAVNASNVDLGARNELQNQQKT